MTQPDRKELSRQYKENPRPAGVFQVKNLATGKLLIGWSADLPGMLNRQRFQLELGSHPDKELQADWDERGPDSFEFTILDELEPGENVSSVDNDELRVLHRMWLDRLEGSELYAQFPRR